MTTNIIKSLQTPGTLFVASAYQEDSLDPCESQFWVVSKNQYLDVHLKAFTVVDVDNSQTVFGYGGNGDRNQQKYGTWIVTNIGYVWLTPAEEDTVTILVKR